MNFSTILIDNSSVRIYESFFEKYYDIITKYNGVEIVFSIKFPKSNIEMEMLEITVKILELKLLYTNLTKKEINNKIKVIKDSLTYLDTNFQIELLDFVNNLNYDDFEILNDFLYNYKPNLSKEIKGKKF